MLDFTTLVYVLLLPGEPDTEALNMFSEMDVSSRTADETIKQKYKEKREEDPSKSMSTKIIPRRLLTTAAQCAKHFLMCTSSSVSPTTIDSRCYPHFPSVK